MNAYTKRLLNQNDVAERAQARKLHSIRLQIARELSGILEARRRADAALSMRGKGRQFRGYALSTDNVTVYSIGTQEPTEREIASENSIGNRMLG